MFASVTCETFVRDVLRGHHLALDKDQGTRALAGLDRVATILAIGLFHRAISGMTRHPLTRPQTFPQSRQIPFGIPAVTESLYLGRWSAQVTYPPRTCGARCVRALSNKFAHNVTQT